MYRITALVTAAGDPALAATRVRAAFAGLAGPPIVNPVVHGHAAGDIACHLVFADAAACRAAGATDLVTRLARDPAVAHVDAIAFRPEIVALGTPAIVAPVHRVLLLAVDPGTPGETEARFLDDLRAMPGMIAAIRNAAIGRADWSFGRRRWTHIWEQDFATLGDLTGPYMAHPYHWGHVDRWFDAEAPNRIVGGDLCHSASTAARSIIAVGA